MGTFCTENFTHLTMYLYIHHKTCGIVVTIILANSYEEQRNYSRVGNQLPKKSHEKEVAFLKLLLTMLF